MLNQLRHFKAAVFQALAHPTRIAIVEALCEGELSAGQLIGRLGLEQANASQHLAVLRARQIVSHRKEGNQVFYSLRHPALINVLEALKKVFHDQLAESKSLFEEMQREDSAHALRRSR